MRKSNHEAAVVGSALWAAAGDALGWITELTDERGLRVRLGTDAPLVAPVPWQRRIGGQFGVTLPLPAGTYSDDTQLRLAVSRAIRGSGDFDVEAFAKIELPTWLTYSLGGGRSTSAAANNLIKSSVSWFSNFFGGRGALSYFEAGGNGAAMRIQPHVWKVRSADEDVLIREVMRDAVVTHGHPQGFCGAVFHAHCVHHAITEGNIPSPDQWVSFLNRLKRIPDAVRADQQLSLFWLPAWEDTTRKSLADAIAEETAEAFGLIDGIRPHLTCDINQAYRSVLAASGGFREDRRGAGLNSALAAAALAWLHRSGPNEEALVHAARTLSSDTDTIGTMAGAILGAANPTEMYWTLQDRGYIEKEARRLAALAAGQKRETFEYPDVMTWEPPSAQVDGVAELDGELVLRGLGRAKPEGEAWKSGESIWQWLRLEFGQTVLAKRRQSPKRTSSREIPKPRREGDEKVPTNVPDALQTAEVAPVLLPVTNLSRGEPQVPATNPKRPPSTQPTSTLDDLDALSDRVIRQDFDPEAIGRAFIELTSRERPVESAVAFAAIIAKAIVARRRRGEPR